MSLTPTLFDPTLASPAPQPTYFGGIGPFENGSDLYWVSDEINTGTGLQNIVVWKSTDSGATYTRFTTGFTDHNQNGNVSVARRKTGTIIDIGWRGRESGGSTGHLHSTTFDMSSDSFGTDNDAGFDVHSDSIYLNQDSDGNLVFVYDDTLAAPTRNVYFILWNGASWTAPALISTGAGNNHVDVVVVDGDTNIGVFWDDLTNIKYSIINSGVVGSAVTALALPATFQSAFPYCGIYDPDSDSIAFCYVQGFATPKIDILIGAPAAAPSFSVTTVATDGADVKNWIQPWLTTDGAGNFSVLAWSDQGSTLAGILELYTATALTGPWTGPTTYYDEVADPPSPAPSVIEIYPVWAVYLADGSLGVTTGMRYEIDSQDFCGVLAYLVPGITPGQTLRLIKAVSGGTASASDWTLSANGPTPISGAGGVGPSAVTAGTYTLSETIGPPGYTASAWNCGATVMPTANSVVVPASGSVVCTITNTYGITPPPPPEFCEVFTPTTPTPSFISYDEPLELQGS